MRTDEIERELREMRSEPDPDFARRLDEWAAADFPADRGLGPRLRERARAQGPFRRLWDRISATPPRRILMPVGAAATALVVVGVVISQNSGDTDTGLTQQTTISDAGVAKTPTASEERSLEAGHAAGASATDEAVTPPFTDPAPVQDSGDGVAAGTDERLVDATARLSLGTEASKVQDVSNQVVDVTDGYDGIVLDSRVTTDQAGARASFKLEIPYKQLDAALADLSGLADVISRTQGGEDITAKANRAQREYQGTLERIRKARLELAQADTRSEKLIIQSQIDSLNASANAYENELKGVKRQARFATVDVEVTSKDSDSGASGAWSIGDAFHDAGRVLEVIGGIGLVTLAVLLPIALVAVLGWAIASRTVKRRREAVLN